MLKLNKLRILVIWIIFLLIADFLFGSQIMTLVTNLTNDYFRIRHSVFHHSLRENISVKDHWGGLTYRLCTDTYGYKTSCNEVPKKNTENLREIVFLGDSFTEGIGLNYEETFVGLLDYSLPDSKIFNLGVASYSPSIYFQKLKTHLKNNNNPDIIILAPDISDVEDEAAIYNVSGDLIPYDYSRSYLDYKLKRVLFNSFPVSTTLIARILQNNQKKNNSKKIPDPRSAWTYLSDEKIPFSLETAIKRFKSSVIEISKLTNDNTELYIVLFPWPDQIKNDPNATKYVDIWNNICKENKICKKVINTFTQFNQVKKKLGKDKLIEQMYINGDVHFNKNGNTFLANIIHKEIFR